MTSLNDLFKLVSEAKKTDPVAVKAKEIKQNIEEDLGGLFSQISTIKEQDPTVQKAKQTKAHIEGVVKDDLSSLFKELAVLKSQKEQLVEQHPQLVEEVQPIVEETLIEVAPVLPSPEERIKTNFADVEKYLGRDSFQQPEPDLVAREFKSITDKIKFLEQSIGRIAAAGPGSGEVNLRWLDDIDRPSIYDMRFLRYNATKKKFEFAEVNPHDIVYTTHLVTTSTYTVDSDDYYVGVNYAGPCTITLPTTLLSSGRSIVIKDESGAAETNPITVVGTVDNDAGGFIIQINNGATQLIYRDGWRII